MADAKLELMRKLMQEDNDKKNGNRSTNTGDKASYPYWNIPEKQTATVRFLPDRDDENPWFWVERQTIKLPFEGVVGGEFPTAGPVLVTVPCIDMFKLTCPIIAASRPWWKTDEKLARTYWKKRSYIAQGFVVGSPFEESDLPENPIRRFYIGPSLLEKLKAGLVDPEMESTPTDYLNGTDFKIKKTRKGDFNNYDTSEWSRRTRPLTESEHIAIEKFQLFDLKDFKGTPPDADGVAMIKAMFHDSVDGKAFDMAAYGAHYKPYGASTTINVPEGVDDFTSTPRNTGAQYARTPTPSEPNADEAEASASQSELITKLRARTAAAARA